MHSSKLAASNNGCTKWRTPIEKGMRREKNDFSFVVNTNPVMLCTRKFLLLLWNTRHKEFRLFATNRRGFTNEETVPNSARQGNAQAFGEQCEPPFNEIVFLFFGGSSAKRRKNNLKLEAKTEARTSTNRKLLKVFKKGWKVLAKQKLVQSHMAEGTNFLFSVCFFPHTVLTEGFLKYPSCIKR
jgi:hypothetical protein